MFFTLVSERENQHATLCCKMHPSLFGVPFVFYGRHQTTMGIRVRMPPVTGNYQLRFERIFVMSEHVRT